MTIAVYGIPNCDTVRKARKWLEQQGVTFEFIDVRKQPVAATTLQAWLTALGRDTVINKKSTAWRQLTQEQQQMTSDEAAIALLQDYPTLMKRPLLAAHGHYLAGFQETLWQAAVEQR